MSNRIAVALLVLGLAATRSPATTEGLSAASIPLHTSVPIDRYALAIIRRPTRVESFRVDPLPFHAYRSWGTPPPFKTFGRIGSRYVTEVGPVLDQELARRTSALFRDPKSYRKAKGPDDFKLCLPEYRHALVFTKGQRRVSILICFSCAQFEVLDEGNHRLGGGDFDPMVGELRAIFESLLPGDAPQPAPN